VLPESGSHERFPGSLPMSSPSERKVAPVRPLRSSLVSPRTSVPLEPEGALLERARRGDRLALETILLEHGASIRKILAWYLDRQDRDDAAQDICVSVLKGLQAFRGESRLGTWIFKIATNVALKQRRRARTRANVRFLPLALVDEHARPPEPEPEESSATLPGVDDVLDALVHLPPEQRSVVLLRGIERLPFKQVAALLDIPVPTAQSRMARAREKLRELCGDC